MRRRSLLENTENGKLIEDGLLFWFDGFYGATTSGSTWNPRKVVSSISTLTFTKSSGSYDGTKWILGASAFLLSNINPFKDCGDNAMTIIVCYSNLSKTEDDYLFGTSQYGNSPRRMGLCLVRSADMGLYIWDAYNQESAGLISTSVTENYGVISMRTDANGTLLNNNSKSGSYSKKHSITDNTNYRFILGGYKGDLYDGPVCPQTLNIHSLVAYNRVLSNDELSVVMKFLSRRYDVEW